MTTDLVPTGIVTACCEIHRTVGRCCDLNDCGPCCPECPTCPIMAAFSPEARRELRAQMEAAHAWMIICVIHGLRSRRADDLAWSLGHDPRGASLSEVSRPRRTPTRLNGALNMPGKRWT